MKIPAYCFFLLKCVWCTSFFFREINENALRARLVQPKDRSYTQKTAANKNFVCPNMKKVSKQNETTFPICLTQREKNRKTAIECLQ